MLAFFVYLNSEFVIQIIIIKIQVYYEEITLIHIHTQAHTQTQNLCI